MAWGQGRGQQCPLPGPPPHFPFLPKFFFPLPGLQAGSRSGSASSIPLRSSPLPSLSHGYQWTHSGTSFMCYLFRSRLYPCDYHRLQAGWGPGWGQGKCKGRKTPEPAVLGGGSSYSLSSPLCWLLPLWTAGPCRPCSRPFCSSSLQPLQKLANPRRKMRQEGGTVPCSFTFSNLRDPLCNLSQLPPPVGLLVTIFSSPGGES